ncbi:hypothetical protein [Vibrio marisflavi]|uniref:Uncharacterized protein n=1 Tax=Vibrio marisflavi CECT 7928 TaxID=634439 RepID=A0ABM9A5C2_9VIBR|nr:hypothetical protein [Vibrio marisflavi]CAH0540318.1 hypothetical protein VMF7928_02763 [Vibrio marisflavi CECT 7928]
MEKIVNFVFKVVGLRTAKQKEKTQRVVDYIDTCLEHMQKIMGYSNDPSSASIEQSRKFLQQAYLELPIQLDGVASTIECDIIKNSIASARIYYHAVKEGKVLDSCLESDYESRFQLYTKHIYDQQMFRQNSYEAFLKQLVKDKREIDKQYIDHELQKIMEVCQEDIARIMILRETLKTRKAAA